MRNLGKKIYYIPPNWSVAALFALCGILFACFLIYNVESALAIFSHFHKPGLFLSCLFAILATSSYSFFTDHLEVKIIGFTIKRVYWKNVTGAMFFDTLTNKRNSRMRQSYLIICIAPCQATNPAGIQFDKFDRQYARNLVRVPVSDITEEVINVLSQLNVEIYR